MTVEDAREGPGVLQVDGIEITEIRIDGGHCGYGMAFTEREHILATPRRVLDFNIEEPAVKQGDERDGGREGSSGVEALVHCITRLLKRQQANVGVFNGEQPEHCLPQQEIR